MTFCDVQCIADRQSICLVKQEDGDGFNKIWSESPD
jgi:hypothetical protein